MNKIYWIIGQMCSGKTYYSKIIGEYLGLKPFHLDHINLSLPLVEAYREAIQSGLIEGFTPLRNKEHYRAIVEAIGDKEVIYILIAPSYEQWKRNCIPVIQNITDENPPDYTEEEYERENKRLEAFKPKVIIK
jgi:hypothetical protein